MSIYQDSRYESADIVPVADRDGVFHATVVNTREVEELPYTTVTVKAGDRLDLLAHTAYGDAELWWRIADANPDLLFPDALVPGQLLRVPSASAFR